MENNNTACLPLHSSYTYIIDLRPCSSINEHMAIPLSQQHHHIVAAPPPSARSRASHSPHPVVAKCRMNRLHPLLDDFFPWLECINCWTDKHNDCLPTTNTATTSYQAGHDKWHVRPCRTVSRSSKQIGPPGSHRIPPVYASSGAEPGGRAGAWA